MFMSRIWVRYSFCAQCVVSKIKCVLYNKFIYFCTNNRSDFFESIGYKYVGWDNQCLMMGHTVKEAIRSWCYIHFAVSNQDVTIATKSTNSLVFMDIFVVSV